jgi:hypothetical protein
MRRSSRLSGVKPSGSLRRFACGAALGVLAAAAAVSVPAVQGTPPAPTARAETPLPLGLAFVPHDAAFFVAADVAAVRTSELTKGFRAADPESYAQLDAAAAKAFGARIDDLKSAALFFPKVKGNEEPGFGVVLTFAKPFDKKKLEAGFVKLAPPGAKIKVLAPSDTVAVVLAGLGAEYEKPQPAGADGPLTAALKAAAGGGHTLVAGVTLGNLPDELQKDDLPGGVRAFQPILKARAVAVTVDLGRALVLNVRVTTKRDAQAVDAEKALAALAKLLADEGGRALPELEKAAATDAGLKDLVKVLAAGVAAAKGAKFEVDGAEARATATLPLDGLPLASAAALAVTRARSAAAAAQSANNLKQIALSLHNYHDANGTFPPAAVCDRKGKPQLSWRVLILPYIEQNELYKQFKLDEPWDGETNKKLLARMPATYAMPGAAGAAKTDTYYRAFVGNGAGWDWVMGGKITQITDGTSNTLMVVTAATAVPWTKPDELEFDPEKDMAKLIGLVVDGKAQVAMFDGSVRTLSKLPSKTTLNALITKNGGEVIGDDF